MTALPLAPRHSHVPAEAPARPSDATDCLTVVVADSDPDVLDAYHELLSCLGHDAVSLVTTGRELVQDVDRFDPELVMIESTLVDTDGLTLAMELQKCRTLPIILVTGEPDPLPLYRALQNTRLVSLDKPFRLLELQAAIRRALECAAGPFVPTRTE